MRERARVDSSGASRIATELVEEDPEYEFARLKLASAEHRPGRALLT